jgi:hypothetical protein
VPNTYFKFPTELIGEWPEVFTDLHMNTMPVNYLKFVRIEFLTGMIWEVNIEDQIKIHGADVVANLLEVTFNEKTTEVKKCSFEIDVLRLKGDVIKLTENLL